MVTVQRGLQVCHNLTLIMSDTITRGIRVQVISEFVPERSAPQKDYYFFSYKVRITNLGKTRAQLISRTWVITDAEGREETVTGPGVVGEQPVLDPGDSFEYTSFCPLTTSVGSMQGSYHMVDSKGEEFEAVIRPFSLAVPTALN